MMSPKRQTFDLPGAGQGHVYGHVAAAASSTPRTRHASAISFVDHLAATGVSSRMSGSEEDLTRAPYRDRKLSESVVSLTGVAEEEEQFILSSNMSTSWTTNANDLDEQHSSSSSKTPAMYNTRTASPMARSSSQRRISQELTGRNGGLVSPRVSASAYAGTAMRFSNSSSGELHASVANIAACQTPARQPAVRRNSARAAGALTPMRQSNRSNSLYTTPALTASQAMHELTIQTSGGVTPSIVDGEDYFAPVHQNEGELSPSAAHAAPRVPFPRSFSTSYAFPADSPSARRIGRHLSLSAAQSTDSVDELSASPNTGARLASVHGRHARYTSDLHIARPNFTSSHSETSFADSRSRSRRSSEMGSYYANTLDDSSTHSNVKITRDPSFVKPSKHQLVIAEEGKPDVILQLGNCIGRGQFGSVYRALNLNTGQMVAVKRIKLVNRSEDEVTQLMHEVELLKSLVHPSVVKYEGLSRGLDVVSIVLEYVENGSLLHTLKAFGNFPEKLVASYVVKILEGLHYLHEMKVVHCDLKAANILTTKNGNVKLSDFGVSLNLKAAEDLKKNDAIGTPNWMAPEVIELKGASTSADIWSLACTIIELLTGKPPYGDMLAMSAMWRIVEDDCPPLPANISVPLRDFLVQCFKKDPALRPSAAMLFEHEWLRTTWKDHKALRPQDSVPFFMRIASHESRKDSVKKSLNGGSSRKASVHRTRQTIPVQALEELRDGEKKAAGSPAIQTVSSVEPKMERSSSSPSDALLTRPRLPSVRACSAPDAWSSIKPPTSKEESTSSNESVLAASAERSDSQLTTASNSASENALFSPSGMSACMSTSPPTLLSFDLATGRRGSDVASTTTSIDLLRSPSTAVAIGSMPVHDTSMLDLTQSDVFLLDEQASANKTHAFVKSSFAKAVQCKICREAVKKHAVLCEDCGLICHASCARRAAMPCNLRAQLLMFAAHNQRSSMDVTRVMSPTPSASTPPPPHTPTAIGSPPLFRLPFGNKYKRNSRAGASDLNLPSTLSSSPPSQHAVSTSLGDQQLSAAITQAKLPTTTVSPAIIAPTPLSPAPIVESTIDVTKALEGEIGGNKRQKRTRRISLLPSHLMRRRSPSPAPVVASTASPLSPKTAPILKPETVIILSSPDSTPSQTVSEERNNDDGCAIGGDQSHLSSISSGFQLASPASPTSFSSYERSQFPSIEARGETRTPRAPARQSSAHAAEPMIKLQDPPRKPVPRRQRFLSTGATPLSLSSTPNLVGNASNVKLASDVLPTPPVSANARLHGAMPWKRGQSNTNADDKRLQRSESEMSNVDGNGRANAAERRHNRRLSSKQDCVIA